jgi:hypothetical protein
MSTEAISIEEELFAPVRVNEETLEGILRSEASGLFNGWSYYDFRPPIPSRHGTRHPDGAIVAGGSAEWWVVEVELHTHDVDAHILPQLEGLADGIYGWEAFSYLTRHPGFDASEFATVDVWDPAFLLIVDHATPQIRAAAAQSNFSVLECAVFRSVYNRYGIAASGFRPRRTDAPRPGIDVELGELQGVATLSPIGKRTFPKLLPSLVVAGEATRARLTADGQKLVLPLSCREVRDRLGDARYYRVTSDQHLIAVPT